MCETKLSIFNFGKFKRNVLEWYDFAGTYAYRSILAKLQLWERNLTSSHMRCYSVFGFFSDVLGQVFFPKDQPEDLSVMESFAVFGGAFLMRPVGGLIIGYIGDVSGRKTALEISIFLMAIATTCMGCLPTYDQIGGGAILLLLMVRMLQGLSVGGQLMSSLVFTVEGHPRKKWGLYGSCVLAAGNFGTLLGGIIAFWLRSSLTEEQLLNWGWRIPFLSGILISVCGIYLKFFCQDDEILPGHAPVPTSDAEEDHDMDELEIGDGKRSSTKEDDMVQAPRANPLRVAFSRENFRSLLASAMVPMLWSGGFYISFVWMAIYMQDLIVPPVPSAFAINSGCLLLLSLWFPVAGILSDNFGRKLIMSLGGVGFGCLGPIMIFKISQTGGSDTWVPTFAYQTILSLVLALFGAPMCAWLVEAFEPDARLTSVSIGYNMAQAIAGGMSPFIATLLVDKVGIAAPGLLLSILAGISMAGLCWVAPSQESTARSLHTEAKENQSIMSLELPEIS